MIIDSEPALSALETPMAQLEPSQPRPMHGTPEIISSALRQYALAARRAGDWLDSTYAAERREP